MLWLIAALSAIAIGQALLIAWWSLSGNVAWAAATTGTVTITSTPPGAAVIIDGAARGATPLTLDLESGDHQLQVGADTNVWSQDLRVAAGTPAIVHVVHTGTDLPATAGDLGTLEITTDPAGLAVSVDGRAHGSSPISVTGLKPGSHEVAVTRGSAVSRRTVSVEAGVPTAVLITTGSAGIPSGWLSVTAPVPVQIEEDGTLLGSSSTPRLLLPVGRHELTFSNEALGYQVRQTVQVTAGQGATVSLAGANGSLSVNAQPWGEVFVDGRRIGETPIGNLALPIGNHEVIVRHPQLGERRRTVAVGVSTPARVGFDLRQP